jgi:beta-galactosidase
MQAGAAGVGAVVAGQVLSAAPARAATGPAAITIPFDTNWLFGSYVDGGAAPGFDDSDLSTVSLPHTVVPLSWRNWDPTTWERIWLYRRHFDAPDDLGGMRVFLDFDGALTGSTVTLNGHQSPAHLGGYLPFSAEITGQLQPKANVLAVQLDSRYNLDVPPDRPAPSVSTDVDFWQPGGLYRDVSLRIVPAAFIADVFAKPVDVLDPAKRAVQVDCTIDAATLPKNAAVTIELRDGAHRISSTTVAVDQDTVTGTLTGLEHVTLWDLDNPYLYDVVVTLSIGGKAVHDYRSRIGFREATFGLHGFTLNGKRVQLFGLNRHQFFPFAGGAMPARVQRRDAEILRTELNCNVVRCSHYPQSEAFLDACDEFGLMVWEEAPGWGYLGDDAWKQLVIRDVGDMIRRDRNHPSVIIWGARLNETDDDVSLYTETQNLAHSLDDSRPTVGAMAGRHDTPNYEQDVFSQNDYSSSTGPDGKKQPELMPPRTDRPYMISETVGTLSGPAIYFRRIDTQDVQQGQATALARVHNIAASDDRYCGVIAWSGYDYCSGSGNIFQEVKYTGVVDLFRIPKPGAAIYQSQVDPKSKPVIQPAFYWDFGATSPITTLSSAMICSNLDRLEIYVGGSHFATATPDTTNYGHLAYPPSFVDFSKAVAGDLRIDGYLGSRRVASRAFSADSTKDRLILSIDDTELVGDGSDASRVTFRAVDRFGQPRPYVSGAVTLSVRGPAILIGDNPFPFADTGGAGAVWLRTLRDTPGTITVTASHPTLGKASATLRIQATGGTPIPYGTLTASTPTGLAAAGDQTPVTATFSNIGLPRLDTLALSLRSPDGWTARPITPTSFTRIANNRAVQATWLLDVPANTTPGSFTGTVEAVYVARGERGVTYADAPVAVPYPSVNAAFDNTGISDDADIDSANFDGVGNSYSAQALATAGVKPGMQFSYAGVSLGWPDVAPGSPDNVLADAQTVLLSGSGSTLVFLGSGSPGDEGGQGTVHYDDGTTSAFSVVLDNYFAAPTGNDAIVSTPYINSQGLGGRPRGQRQQTVYIDATKVPITPGKKVIAVTLPAGGVTGSDGRITGMHVFALGIG